MYLAQTLLCEPGRRLSLLNGGNPHPKMQQNPIKIVICSRMPSVCLDVFSLLHAVFSDRVLEFQSKLLMFPIKTFK